MVTFMTLCMSCHVLGCLVQNMSSWTPINELFSLCHLIRFLLFIQTTSIFKVWQFD